MDLSSRGGIFQTPDYGGYASLTRKRKDESIRAVDNSNQNYSDIFNTGPNQTASGDKRKVRLRSNDISATNATHLDPRKADQAKEDRKKIVLGI